MPRPPHRESFPRDSRVHPIVSLCRSSYDDGMTNCNHNGRECDRWVMLHHDGQRTLYRLVEVGKETEILRLAGELPAPAVVVEMALPALPALDDTPGKNPRSASSRLILLNVRRATGDDADGAVVRRFVRERP